MPNKPDTLDATIDPIEARRKAMDYLARREYGRLELQSKLERAGFASETAAAAVDRLASEGLQCDRRYIENFIASRIDQGKGPLRIRRELDERGLDSRLVDELLADTGQDWVSMARRIRERKFGAELPADFKEKARQMRFLQYRGFDSAQVRMAVAPHEEY